MKPWVNVLGPLDADGDICSKESVLADCRSLPDAAASLEALSARSALGLLSAGFHESGPGSELLGKVLSALSHLTPQRPESPLSVGSWERLPGCGASLPVLSVQVEAGRQGPWGPVQLNFIFISVDLALGFKFKIFTWFPLPAPVGTSLSMLCYLGPGEERLGELCPFCFLQGYFYYYTKGGYFVLSFL